MTAPLKVTHELIARHARQAGDLRMAEFHARIAAVWNFFFHRARHPRAVPCAEAF